MGKTFPGKNPHQINLSSPHLKNPLIKNKWLQVQGILPFWPIPKYLPTVEPLLQSPIKLDFVEAFSFAQIPIHD